MEFRRDKILEHQREKGIAKLSLWKIMALQNREMKEQESHHNGGKTSRKQLQLYMKLCGK